MIKKQYKNHNIFNSKFKDTTVDTISDLKQFIELYYKIHSNNSKKLLTEDLETEIEMEVTNDKLN